MSRERVLGGYMSGGYGLEPEKTRIDQLLLKLSGCSTIVPVKNICSPFALSKVLKTLKETQDKELLICAKVVKMTKRQRA